MVFSTLPAGPRLPGSLPTVELDSAGRIPGSPDVCQLLWEAPTANLEYLTNRDGLIEYSLSVRGNQRELRYNYRSVKSGGPPSVSNIINIISSKELNPLPLPSVLIAVLSWPPCLSNAAPSPAAIR